MNFITFQLETLQILLIWIFSEERKIDTKYDGDSNEVLKSGYEGNSTKINFSNRKNRQVVTKLFHDVFEFEIRMLVTLEYRMNWEG